MFKFKVKLLLLLNETADSLAKRVTNSDTLIDWISPEDTPQNRGSSGSLSSPTVPANIILRMGTSPTLNRLTIGFSKYATMF